MHRSMESYSKSGEIRQRLLTTHVPAPRVPTGPDTNQCKESHGEPELRCAVRGRIYICDATKARCSTCHQNNCVGDDALQRLHYRRDHLAAAVVRLLVD